MSSVEKSVADIVGTVVGVILLGCFAAIAVALTARAILWII